MEMVQRMQFEPTGIPGDTVNVARTIGLSLQSTIETRTQQFRDLGLPPSVGVKGILLIGDLSRASLNTPEGHIRYYLFTDGTYGARDEEFELLLSAQMRQKLCDAGIIQKSDDGFLGPRIELKDVVELESGDKMTKKTINQFLHTELHPAHTPYFYISVN